MDPSTRLEQCRLHLPHYLRLHRYPHLIGRAGTEVHQGSLHPASAIYTYRPFLRAERQGQVASLPFALIPYRPCFDDAMLFKHFINVHVAH